VIEQLGQAGIESRKWWPRGCANMTAYQHYPRLALPVTEKLCDEVIALPFSVDLNKEEIDFIATELGALIG
jgi:dTDP-4-amino-4,6-dideoxygalactose transaminase